MKNLHSISIFFYTLFAMSCSGDNDAANPVQSANPPTQTETNPPAATYKYLALGDSYTIGQSVCETCRFPEQLKAQLTNPATNINLSIIATTGWTTSNLISAINSQNPTNDNDLVTLLIGVNNQYQHKPFSVYESEFPQLVTKSIALAKGDKTNVIVVSIPDYAFTPYGQSTSNQATISQEIDQYNNFAQQYCEANGIIFINITDITRLGLTNPNYVTTDGLHPSQIAYSLFVERILPKALIAISQ